MGQKLRGLVGQGMTGRRAPLKPLSYVYGPGSYTFSPKKGGWYRFILWGPGGPSGAGFVSSGGALVVAERAVAVGQRVAIVVGQCDLSTASDTTLSLPTGEVLTAGAGQSGNVAAGGSASGNVGLGDILVVGGSSFGAPGAGASFGTYLGGVPGTDRANGPGAGCSPNHPPGSGLVVVHQVRMAD